MSTPMTVMLPPDLGQVAFGLQGSGSLGADQVAVDQALHEAGVEPDWATSTSIGAINASIIAGNKPTKRVSGLTAFWQSVESRSVPTGNRNTPLRGRGHRSGSL